MKIEEFKGFIDDHCRDLARDRMRKITHFIREVLERAIPGTAHLDDADLATVALARGMEVIEVHAANIKQPAILVAMLGGREIGRAELRYPWQ